MAVPTVTALDLASGPAGTLVTITGTNFDNRVTRVNFGSVSCGTNFTVLSTTDLSAWVPAGSGTVYVTVTNPEGTSANSVQWTYSTYYGGTGSAPTVSGLATVPPTTPPQSAYTDGRGGDTVVITGTNFTTTQAVYFGGAMAEFTVNSSTQITAIAPPGSGTVDVIVVTLYGTSTNTAADNFLYPTVSVPTVTSLVPASGLEGDAVTINGTGFDTAMSVEFGTVPAVFLILSSTQIRCFVPFGLTAGTTYDVAVTNSGGVNTNTSADNFTYATLGTLKTTATNLQTSPSEGWTTTNPVSVTLTATYVGGPGVESTWYRVDDGATTKYTAAISVSRTTLGEGSHKLEYWSVGLDGTIEPTNVGWVNMVASTTATGLTATAAIGAIVYGWTPINIPGARYDVCIGTSNPPSTTPVAVVNTTTYTHKIAAGATAVYCRVRLLMPDGTYGSYSSVVGPTSSLTLVATDLADDSITLAKLAPTIIPPVLYTGAALPTLPDAQYPEGTILYWTNYDTLYKTTTGLVGSWVKLIATNDLQDDAVTADKIYANTITAGEIAAGAIGAEELAADSVFAKNLVVADFDNLVPNANSELDPTGKDTAWNSTDLDFRGVTTNTPRGGTRCRERVASGTGTMNYIDVSDLMPCKVGDSFRFTAWSRMSTAEASYGCRVRLVALTAALAEVGADTAISTYNGTTTYAEQTVTNAITDSTAVWVKAQVCVNATAGYYGRFDDMLFRRMLKGNLIVDGTLSANAIYGGTITGADVTVERTLLLGTGGAIKTASSGKRIEIVQANYDRIKFYSGSASETTEGDIYVAAGSGTADLSFRPPNLGSYRPYILCTSVASGSEAYAKLRLFGWVTIEETSSWGGTLSVANTMSAGKVAVSTNWSSGTSDDGVWIQEGSATAGYDASRRWKTYYDTQNHRLYVRYSGGDYAYFATDGRAGVA